jgi:autotransporter-associated beta strand protein
MLTLGSTDALANSTLDMNASDSGVVTFSQNSRLGGLTGSRDFDNGGRDLLIGGNNASTTYSGRVWGDGVLVKQGSGTLTLSGYIGGRGPVTIAAGTLRFGTDIAVAAGKDLTVNEGGTLDLAGYENLFNTSVIDGIVMTAGFRAFGTHHLMGTGTLNGPVFVDVDHSPGAAQPGIQTFTGGLSYSPGTAVHWKLFANSTSLPGVNYSQIVVPTGNVQFQWDPGDSTSLVIDCAGGSVNWSDVFWDSSHEWTIFDVGTGATQNFSQLRAPVDQYTRDST